MDPAIKEIPLPKYIAVEGPIGVGKTTLANTCRKPILEELL
jgi:deoxyadenosine/deoxycytidine kinase